MEGELTLALTPTLATCAGACASVPATRPLSFAACLSSSVAVASRCGLLDGLQQQSEEEQGGGGAAAALPPRLEGQRCLLYGAVA